MLGTIAPGYWRIYCLAFPLGQQVSEERSRKVAGLFPTRAVFASVVYRTTGRLPQFFIYSHIQETVRRNVVRW